MKEAVFNKSGMKQITDSGFKTFDQQNNLVAYGSLISTCQVSAFLTERTIQDRTFNRLPEPILRDIMGLAKRVRLYQFHIWRKGIKQVFLQIAMDEAGKVLWEKHYEPNKYRLRAINWIKEYIIKEE